MTLSIQSPQAACAPAPRAPDKAQPAGLDRDLDLDRDLLVAARPAPSRAHKTLSALVTPCPLLKQSVARVAKAVQPLLPTLVAVGTVACLVSVARGYACTGHGKSDQSFANSNGTLHGVVHGWFANCEDYTYPCGQSCSTAGLSQSCSTVYCTNTEVTRSVKDVVGGVATLVQKCGLDLVSNIPAGDLLRIANPLIERNKWVKIAVNTLNVTQVTDPAVLCLHAIQ